MVIQLSDICQDASKEAEHYSIERAYLPFDISENGTPILLNSHEPPEAFLAAAARLKEISLSSGNSPVISLALNLALTIYLMDKMESGQCSVLTPAVVQLHKGACGHYGGNLASCIYAALTFTGVDELCLPDFILENGWRMVIDPQAALFAKKRKNNADYSLCVCETPSHNKWPERDAIVVASCLVDHLFSRSPIGYVLPSAENVQNFRQRVMEKVGTELWEAALTSPGRHIELVLSNCGHLAPWLLDVLKGSRITEGYFPPQYLAVRIYPNGQHNRIKVHLDPNLPKGHPSAVIGAREE